MKTAAQPQDNTLAVGLAATRVKAIAAIASEMTTVIREFQWRAEHRLYEGQRHWRTSDTGFTYVLRSVDLGLVKIGRANVPVTRLRSIQAASPAPLELLALFKGGHVETLLHAIYRGYREHGEWFRLSIALLTDLIIEVGPTHASHVVVSQAFVREKPEYFSFAEGTGRLKCTARWSRTESVR